MDKIKEFIENSSFNGSKVYIIKENEKPEDKILEILEKINAKNLVFSREKEVLSIMEELKYRINCYFFDEKKLNEDLDVGITSCVCGIADAGAIVLMPSMNSPQWISLLPLHHIVVLSEGKIFKSIEEFFKNFPLPTSSIIFIAGPSKTADIEKKIVFGVHGPLSLHILIITKN